MKKVKYVPVCLLKPEKMIETDFFASPINFYSPSTIFSVLGDTNGSLGPARTPRGATKNKAIDDQVMSTPLKALHDAAKRLFCDEGGSNKTLVFLSPSKRQPKRVKLMSVDTRYESRAQLLASFYGNTKINNSVVF